MKLHKVVAFDSTTASTACGFQWQIKNLRTANEHEVAVAYDEHYICGRCRKSLMPTRFYVEAQIRNP